MMKMNFHGMMDTEEFESLTIGGILKSIGVSFLYFLVCLWTSLMVRVPQLCYKLIGFQGLAIALSFYVASKGQSASLPEILSSVTAFGISAVKTHYDSKTPVVKEPTTEKIKEPTDEPKN